MAGFAVDLQGTATRGIVRCDQLRALDLTARQARRVERVPQVIIDDVLARVTAILT